MGTSFCRLPFMTRARKKRSNLSSLEAGDRARQQAAERDSFKGCHYWTTTRQLVLVPALLIGLRASSFELRASCFKLMAAIPNGLVHAHNVAADYSRTNAIASSSELSRSSSVSRPCMAFACLLGAGFSIDLQQNRCTSYLFPVSL